MNYSIEKIVNDIVSSFDADDFSVQKRHLLTQSLLALARAAHLAGHQRGCQDTIDEINKKLRFKKKNSLDPTSDCDPSILTPNRH